METIDLEELYLKSSFKKEYRLTTNNDLAPCARLYMVNILKNTEEWSLLPITLAFFPTWLNPTTEERFVIFYFENYPEKTHQVSISKFTDRIFNKNEFEPYYATLYLAKRN